MSFHKRVIPMDFFNESKLLKCLGKLEVAIMDGKANFSDSKLRSEHDGTPFVICQNDADGSIYCLNYHVFYGDETVLFYLPYNSKENWPLRASYRGEDFQVFDDDGELAL